jgi:hypothetical protein
LAVANHGPVKTSCDPKIGLVRLQAVHDCLSSNYAGVFVPASNFVRKAPAGTNFGETVVDVHVHASFINTCTRLSSSICDRDDHSLLEMHYDHLLGSRSSIRKLLVLQVSANVACQGIKELWLWQARTVVTA